MPLLAELQHHLASFTFSHAGCKLTRYLCMAFHCRYFRLRWVTPARPFLDPKKRYLFLHFPHAVFPMGSFLSMGLTGNEGAPCCTRHRGLQHDAVLLYEAVLQFGCISEASEHTCKARTCCTKDACKSSAACIISCRIPQGISHPQGTIFALLSLL